MVYIVDTEFNHLDKPILTNPDGSHFAEDDGVTELFPRYGYVKPVDGGKGSNDYGVKYGLLFKGNIDYSAYLAVQGDSYTIEGIKIEFISTGDYETIRVSKSS